MMFKIMILFVLADFLIGGPVAVEAVGELEYFNIKY